MAAPGRATSNSCEFNQPIAPGSPVGRGISRTHDEEGTGGAVEPARRPPDAATPRAPSARCRAGRRLRWQASTPLPPATSPRQLARSRSPIGTRADNQFGSSRSFGGAPGPNVAASIDRGNASSTAFAASGGNVRPPTAPAAGPWQAGWFGRRAALVPGRHRLGLPFDLAHTYVRIRRGHVLPSASLARRLALRGRVHDCSFLNSIGVLQ